MEIVKIGNIKGPPGPSGPTGVSSDADNQATLGSDGLIWVGGGGGGGNIGITDGSEAAPGEIGEYLQNWGETSVVKNQYTPVAGLDLSPGEWFVWGSARLSDQDYMNFAPVFSFIALGFNTATTSIDYYDGTAMMLGTMESAPILPIGPKRYNFAQPRSVYLVIRMSGNPLNYPYAEAKILARRMR